MIQKRDIWSYSICMANKYESEAKERRDRFQRSRWDLEGRERQRDWIWVRSLLMDAHTSDSKLPPLPLQYSTRSSASRLLNCSFFAFWYISDSVLPPPPPPPPSPSPSNAVAADSISNTHQHQQR